uniref:Uncharacterized protein n=1 Tax=viral metagenome TaxID=1070528 RepID=A0A6M3L450_9ZZZZ
MTERRGTSRVRDELLNATRHSDETKDSTGRFGSFFKDDLDVPFWKCGEGEHIIDILPFRAGKNHPITEDGKYTYLLDIWVHRNIGPNEDNVVCPARNYKKPCPICEYLVDVSKKSDIDEEELNELRSSLRPKRRVVYNILVYDTAEEESKGIQVWEVSHWFMEKRIAPLSKTRTGEYIPFSDPVDGKSIAFYRHGTGAQNTEFGGHRLEDRVTEGGKSYSIGDDLLKKAHILDDLIVISTYDELKKLFHGGSEEEQEEPKVEKEKSKTPDSKCPGEGTFGVDYDQLKPCETCPEKTYRECKKESEKPVADEGKVTRRRRTI